MITLTLSPREAEIARMIQSGHDYAEIGRALGISSGTVKTHASRIWPKLRISGSARELRNKLKSMEFPE